MISVSLVKTGGGSNTPGLLKLPRKAQLRTSLCLQVSGVHRPKARHASFAPSPFLQASQQEAVGDLLRAASDDGGVFFLDEGERRRGGGMVGEVKGYVWMWRRAAAVVG